MATEPGEGDWLMHTLKHIGYTNQHEAVQMKEELALLVICHKHFTYLSPNTWCVNVGENPKVLSSMSSGLDTADRPKFPYAQFLPSLAH